MNRRRPFLKKPLLIVIIAALAGAAAVAAVRLLPFDQRQLEGAYGRLDTAMRNHNLAEYMAQLAPNYHEQRTLNGKFLSRSEAQTHYQKVMQDWNNIRDQKFDIYRLAVKGNTAIVILERKLTADMSDPRPVHGAKTQIHQVHLTTMEGNTWDRSSGHWLLKMRSVTAIEMTIDGKHLRAGTFDDDHHHDG